MTIITIMSALLIVIVILYYVHTVFCELTGNN